MKPLDLDDLNARAAAYRGVEDGGLPNAWTREQVFERMIEALDVATKTAGRIGPSSASGFWPAIYYEFADYVGREEGLDYLKDRRAEIQRQADREFSSLQFSRAEEALNWASRYLADAPVMADALQLWALCKARRLSVERALRKRVLAADRLRRMRAKDADAEHAKKTAHRRRLIAAEWAAWANDRLPKEKDPRAKARIRAGAREKARLAVREAERANPRPSTKIRRAEVMPGRVFDRAYLDRLRKEAGDVLAAALQRDGVMVR